MALPTESTLFARRICQTGRPVSDANFANLQTSNLAICGATLLDLLISEPETGPVIRALLGVPIVTGIVPTAGGFTFTVSGVDGTVTSTVVTIAP